MGKKIVFSLLALIASVTSEPQAALYYVSPLYGPTYSAFPGTANVVSAALTAPATVPLPTLPVAPTLPAVPSYPVSAYSYGTSVSVPDYSSYVLSSAYVAGPPYSAYTLLSSLGK